VNVALRALTLPGASVALGLGQLAPAAVAAAALRAAAGFGLPAALRADLNEALTVLGALRDPAARNAFLRVLRHVVDWRGQLITMRDRAYLTEGVPTLVVWGEQDHELPVEHAYAAAELMPGSRTVVLPGVGHFPHREAPEAFIEAVTGFIDSTRPNRWDAKRWRQLLRINSRGPGLALAS
jgi:pimeloyl-ACP methyl ester carboxylesterase